MRNLKKVLSLSLALVMLLGMMVVGAGAATYEDVPAGSDKEEAIEVMSAIKVIQGTGDGFNPEGTLDRAQAAIIIARVLLTPSVVEKLSGVDCEFADVAPYPWAAPAIQACANAGIIAGDGAGNFDPTGKVTGVQFAKMLLVTLGFDADKYVGANWEMATRQDAIKAGLDANGVTLAGDLTREDAAQMAFNAVAEYSPSGSTGYYVGENKSVVYSSLTEAMLAVMASDSLSAEDIHQAIAKDTLASTVFGLTPDTDVDAFGRAVKTWSLKGEDEPFYTSSTPVGSSATYTTKQNLKAANVKFVAGGAEVYENSAEANAEKISTAAALNALTGNGVQVDVYKNSSNEIFKVVVVDTYLMKISRISAKTIALANVAGTSAKVVGEKDPCFDTLSGMEKDDYILVTIADGKVQTVVEPEVVSGVTKSNTNKGINIDGAVYPFAKVDATVSSLPVDAEKTATIYVDAAGNAYYGTSEATPVSTTAPYIYVTTKYKTLDKYSDGTVDVKMIQGVLSDGTVVEWKLSDSSTVDYATTTAGNLYHYTKAGSAYKLDAAVTGTAADAGTIASTGSIDANATRLTRTAGQTTLFADDVMFIFVDGTGGDDLTVSALPGVHAVTNETIWWISKTEEGTSTPVIKTVFVIAEAPVESEDLIFVSKTLTGSDKRYLGEDNKTTLYAYDVYLNGEVVENALFAKQAVDNGSVGMHTYTIDEKTGAYVLGAKITTKSDVTVGASDVEKTRGGTYFVKDMRANDVVIVDTRSNVGNIGKITDIGELYEACQVWDLTISYVDADKEMLYIYIQDAAVEQTLNEDAEVETVAAGEKVTVTNGTLTVTDTIETGAEIVVEGSAELVIDSAVEAGAKITVDDLSKVSLGDNADITDGSIKSAVVLKTTNQSDGLDKTKITSAGEGVPVYAANGAKDSTGGGWNIQDKTVAVNWTYGTITLPDGVEKVTVKESISDGKRTCTFTNEEQTPTGGACTMFCLTNLGDDTNNIADWSGTGGYTSFADSKAGGTLTIKVEVYNGTTLVKTIVNFSMPNPCK